METSDSRLNETRDILVIDDDPEMCKLLKKILRSEDYRVQTSVSGIEGLQLLEQKVFDLVISDVKMPDISGIELARHAKAISPQTRIILITAFGDIQTYIQAKSAGVFELISKPVKMKDLSMVVERAIHHNQPKYAM